MKMNETELRQAVEATAAATGFSIALVEKDYQCSRVLKRLYENEFLQKNLIFKGGTLLSKCYLPFFRMSEDLDFSVTNEFCGQRKDRRKVADTIREIIPNILGELGFREVSKFQGFNESRQYNAIFGYPSVSLPEDIIKVEIGFRGDLMLSPEVGFLQTLLKNPFNISDPILLPFEALVLSSKEAFAEKARAALTRQTPAIRDFYDISAISQSGFSLLDGDFVSLVNRKIMADDTAQIDLSKSKKVHLRERIETELKGVLRANDDFLLEKSWILLEQLSELLGKEQRV